MDDLQKFVQTAQKRYTEMELPFSRIADLLDALISAYRQACRDAGPEDWSTEIVEGLSFECSECGRLETHAVLLGAVVGRLADTRVPVVAFGPQIGALCRGECPGCGSSNVVVRSQLPTSHGERHSGASTVAGVTDDGEARVRVTGIIRDYVEERDRADLLERARREIKSGGFSDALEELAREKGDRLAEAIDQLAIVPGNTPLHEAVRGSLESTRQLLEQGADPNARNARGETPLQFRLHLYRQMLAMVPPGLSRKPHQDMFAREDKRFFALFREFGGEVPSLWSRFLEWLNRL